MPDDPEPPARPPTDDAPRALGRLDRFVKRALQLLAQVACRLPYPIAMRIGRWLGHFAYVAIPKKARYAHRNLQLAFRGAMPRDRRTVLIRRMFAQAGMNFVDMLRFGAQGSDDWRRMVRINTEEEETWRQTTADRGGLVLSAHFGNFDLAAIMCAVTGPPMHQLTKRLGDGGVNAFWQEHRLTDRVAPIHREGAMRAMLTALKQKHAIGFVLDQNRPRDEGVFVPFFGIPASSIPTLAALARRTDVPVFSAFIRRISETSYPSHELRIEGPIPFTKTDDPDADILRATARYQQITEDWVRRYPDQWIWMHLRWKSQRLSDNGEPRVDYYAGLGYFS
jgi:KDO2-lipid IV(A) lauroyltransferase